MSEHSFGGSYYTVRRFVRRLEPVQELPFRRLECEPGDEAQVDFGTGAPVITSDGKRHRTHVFRIVLSHSRKAYSEAVYRQTTDDFLRCIENAFRHFGGAPRRLVLDNLKAAVKKADWFDPELNPKVRSFAEYYGFIFWPTRPRTPRHKGKVEKGIDYVQSNALKARRFTRLEEQNAFLLDWELTVADTRIHGTTRRQVGKHFADVERAGWCPCRCLHSRRFTRAAVPFTVTAMLRSSARLCGTTGVLGREVWVRWDSRLVWIFNDRLEQIALHPRKEPGGFSTPPEFIDPKKISESKRRCLALEQGNYTAGAQEYRLGRGDDPNSRRRRCASTHGPFEPQRSPSDLGHRAGMRDRPRLRRVPPPNHPIALERQAPKQELLPFVSEHSMIRPMSEYGQFVHDAFQSRNERTDS